MKHKGPTGRRCWNCKRVVFENHRRKTAKNPTMYSCPTCRAQAPVQALDQLSKDLGL